MVNKTNAFDDEYEDITIPPANANKKKVLLIIIPILIIIGLIVSFYAVSLPKQNEKVQNYYIVETAASDGTSNNLIFYDLPEITTNLKNKSPETKIKLKLTLETSDSDKINTIEAYIPRIQNLIIEHLVETSAEELQSSEGLYWLKEELLYRINLAVYPIQIKDINFKIFDIQKIK